MGLTLMIISMNTCLCAETSCVFDNIELHARICRLSDSRSNHLYYDYEFVHSQICIEHSLCALYCIMCLLKTAGKESRCGPCLHGTSRLGTRKHEVNEPR